MLLNFMQRVLKCRQAFATISSILPWGLAWNVPIQIPSYTIFSFNGLFIETFYFVVVVCLGFTVAAIMLMQKKLSLPERVEVVLGGYILPLLGDGFFLPLTNGTCTVVIEFD